MTCFMCILHLCSIQRNILSSMHYFAAPSVHLHSCTSFFFFFFPLYYQLLIVSTNRHCQGMSKTSCYTKLFTPLESSTSIATITQALNGMCNIPLKSMRFVYFLLFSSTTYLSGLEISWTLLLKIQQKLFSAA